MKRKLVLLLLLCSAFGTRAKVIPEKFEKATFYSVMQTGDLDAVTNEAEVVKGSEIKGKEGYEGVLLMKKAGLLKRPKERLSAFKEGRIKLETAIQADNDNIEFRFLRLVIEENAPKIVKYHSDIEKDKALIIKHYKDLPPVVQRAIADYAKKSKVLHPDDLTLTGNG